MASRSNPWPSLVDLFSALFVFAFGGLVAVTAVQSNAEKEWSKQRGTITRIDSIKNVFKAELQKSLSASNIKGRQRECGDDICFDLYVHFEVDKDVFTNPPEVIELRKIAAGLKEVIDYSTTKKIVEIDVEGHSDSQQPKLNYLDAKTSYLYNWNLSSQRAQAVLYEFAQMGLKPPEYNIVAIGFADSKIIAPGYSEEDHQKNRRTTIRIRIDTQEAERYLFRKLLKNGAEGRL